MPSLSVLQLTEHIQRVLETELEPLYWVVGELSDFRQAPQGHVYFELVEKQGAQIQAKIRANLWQYTYRTVASKFESVTGTTLKNGMKVLAQVSVTFHPAYGLSLNVKDIDPSFSLGERARLRQETITRLGSEGWIGHNARLSLPPVIQRIAVISSPTAAGYGDFINQLDENPYHYRVYHRLFPSLMQGNEAVTNLIAALEQVGQQATRLQLDAVVLIRGGGAQLDLDCFDDYQLAVTIAKFPLPIFTGIGHERDETIVDLVGHTSLKTPTAVAEFILSSFREYEEQLGFGTQRLDRLTRNTLKGENTKVQEVSMHIKGLVKQQLSREIDKVTSFQTRMLQSGKSHTKHEHGVLDQKILLLKKEMLRFLKLQREKIDHQEISVRQLDPINLFQKGYTRTESNGLPIQLVQLEEGDSLTTYTAHQRINSTVTQLQKK